MPITDSVKPFEPPDKVLYLVFATALLASAAVYALHAGDFLVFDSVRVLAKNSLLQFNPLEFDRWRVAALSSLTTGPLGRPLSSLSFAIDVQLAGGVEPYRIRMSNLLLHLMIGLFGWRLFRLALAESPLTNADSKRARWAATIAMAIWVIHPLHVSTVLYAVQRMTQLSTLFVVAGLWFYCARRAAWLKRAPTAGDFSSVLLGLAVFTALAAFSKENGVLLPLYAAVLELTLFRGRVADGRAMLPYRLSQVALLIPALALALLLIIRPDWLLDWYEYRDFGPWERFLTQLRALWLYLGWLVPWGVQPFGLFHDDVELSTSLLQPWTTLPAVIGWVGAGFAAWWLRGRLPLFAFAFLWYLAGHSMESTLIPLELVFEHRNYLPSMGPLLLLGWLITAAPARRYALALSATGLVLVVLGGLLFLRSSYWVSELSQAEAQYRHHPGSLRSRLHLANVYVQQMAGQRDQKVVREYFMAARELHWRNVQEDRGYVPSLFPLVYLESLARRPEEVQRLYLQLAAVMKEQDTRVAEASSLRQLVTCIDTAACLPPPGGARAYLELLVQQRDTLFTRELLMQHCLTVRDYDCVGEQAETALAMDAGFVQGYLSLFNANFARGDTSGAYMAAQGMLQADQHRLQIHGIRDGVRMLAAGSQ